MKMIIGVMRSAGDSQAEEVMSLSYQLGEVIVDKNMVLLLALVLLFLMNVLKISLFIPAVD